MNFGMNWRSIASGDLRLDDIVAILKLLESEYDIEKWWAAKMKVFKPTREQVLKAMLNVSKRYELKFGAICGAGTGTYKNGLDTTFHTGRRGAEDTDSFSVYWNGDAYVPSPRIFKEGIRITRPYMASFVADLHPFETWEADTERQLDEIGVQKPVGNCFVRLHWWDYFDAHQVEALGGFDQCMTAPAYNVEEFNGGVIIQLTKEPFDVTNETHLATRLAVKKHLGFPRPYHPSAILKEPIPLPEHGPWDEDYQVEEP